MGITDRLTRVVKSWTGVFKGEPRLWLNNEQARMLLTSVGLQMSAEAYAKLTNSQAHLDDFLAQLYAAEAETGTTLYNDLYEIDPALSPKVMEGEGKVVITIEWKGQRMILAELKP